LPSLSNAFDKPAAMELNGPAGAVADRRCGISITGAAPVENIGKYSMISLLLPIRH
jgi:hypothetical protein